MKISRTILKAADIELRGEWDACLPKVTQDNRELVQGELFWALKGEKQDGHGYVLPAFEDYGASIAAVNRDWADSMGDKLKGRTLFVMEDTLEGLHKLAMEVRKSFGSIVIAVTGSNGKTTTRELMTAALTPGGKTGRNLKNYNNHVGLPLSILNMDGDERFIVLEMGANHVGEIAGLCEIAQPEIGLITNIGSAHIGEFGGIEKVQQAKGELFDYLAAHNGLAVVNLDDERVVMAAHDCPSKVGFTLDEPPADWSWSVYAGKLMSQDHWGRPTVAIEGMTAKLYLPGRHFASGALAAYAVAVEAGVEPGPAVKEIEKVEPLPGRGMIVGLDRGIEMMDECYNANVASIETALNSLTRHSGYKIAVLGDVFELGVYEEEEHRRIGRLLSLDEVDRVYFVGTRMAWAAEEADLAGHPRVERVADDEVEGLAGRIAGDVPDHAAILVKGSRSMGLERVVLGLARRLGPQAEGTA